MLYCYETNANAGADDLLEYVTLNSVGELDQLKTLMGDDLDRKIFLTGEAHGVGVNQELQFEFLKFFVKNANVRFYVLEHPFSTAYFLNQYLRHGDDKLLLEILSFYGPSFFTRETFRHWQQVREFWLSLPDDRKFRLVGVDMEHNILSAIRYLQGFEASQDLTLTTKEELMKILVDIQNDIERNTTYYQTVLGNDYFGYRLVLDNLIDYLTLDENARPGSVRWYRSRDAKMFNNFLRQTEEVGNTRFFGQFGNSHVYQSEQGMVQWFAAKLNDPSSPYHNEVLSIVYLYKNCSYIANLHGTAQPIPGTPQPIPLDTYISDNGVLSEIAGDQMLFTKLNGSNSPFVKELIWELPQQRPWTGTTTDYFQYVVFIPNSKASEPLTNTQCTFDNSYDGQ